MAVSLHDGILVIAVFAYSAFSMPTLLLFLTLYWIGQVAYGILCLLQSVGFWVNVHTYSYFITKQKLSFPIKGF